MYRRVAALGDSSTFGIGDPVPHAVSPTGWRGWGRLLADALDTSYDVSFCNLAVSGATAATVRAGTGPPVTADAGLLRDLLYAVVGTVASGAADRSATVHAESGPAGWTVLVTARQAEQLTDEHLMAGMLATLTFWVGSPALLFALVSRASLDHVFSLTVVVSALAMAASGLAYLLVAGLSFKPTLGGSVIGFMAGELDVVSDDVPRLTGHPATSLADLFARP